MLRTDAENFLAQGLNLIGLVLDTQPEALSRLSLYFQELKKWNRKINLVARSLDERQILENHFLDSLTVLTLLDPVRHERETILDIGTGAGFPGLVLKAACPALSVTLIEPRKNRFFFLKHIVRSLDLPGTKLLDTRLEERCKPGVLSESRFSFIISRAFTDICQFVRLAAPYLEQGGRIVLMKGPGAVDELDKIASNTLSGQFYVAHKRKLSLPFSGAERWLITIKRAVEELH